MDYPQLFLPDAALKKCVDESLPDPTRASAAEIERADRPGNGLFFGADLCFGAGPASLVGVSDSHGTVTVELLEIIEGKTKLSELCSRIAGVTRAFGHNASKSVEIDHWDAIAVADVVANSGACFVSRGEDGAANFGLRKFSHLRAKVVEDRLRLPKHPILLESLRCLQVRAGDNGGPPTVYYKNSCFAGPSSGVVSALVMAMWRAKLWSEMEAKL